MPPFLTQQQNWDCKNLFNNNKLPRNDGLTNFKKHFGVNLKSCLQILLTKPKLAKKQTSAKLIEKKDKDKHLIKNWRPISLLNVENKIISKVFLLD